MGEDIGERVGERAPSSPSASILITYYENGILSTIWVMSLPFTVHPITVIDSGFGPTTQTLSNDVAITTATTGVTALTVAQTNNIGATTATISVTGMATTVPGTAATVRTSTTSQTTSTSSMQTQSGIKTAVSLTIGSSAAASEFASSTSPPSASPTHAKNDSGISAGAAAGIGIGCAVAGALIAFAILFFCMRNRRGRRSSSGNSGAGGYAAPAARSTDEKIPLTGVGAYGGAGIGALVEHNLPQPEEDQAIVEALSKLRSSIKNHVQSYYHNSPTNVGDVNQEGLEALGDDLPMPSSMLRLQLSDPGSRNAALRFCIAWAIISRLNFRSSPSDILLPPEVAGCFQSMRGMENNMKVRDAFLSRWRAITSTLMLPTYGRNAFPVGDSRSSNINNLLELLDSILYPFADGRQDNSQRRRNLEEILKRAAGVAFLLFSQPSSWQFEWEEARAGEPGSLVVFPALLQTADETGRALNPPQAFSQIEVSR